MNDQAQGLVSNPGGVDGTVRLDVESQNDEPSSSDQLAKSQAANSAEAAKVQNALKARKRTKTGCLTCRKRRIKCGEERPTCANCIKSKRGCEGYAPRLTFKDPLSAFRPGWFKGNGAHYQALSAQNGATGQYGRSQSGSGSQTQLPMIAPRLPPQQVLSDYYSPAKSTTADWSGDSYSSYANGLGGPMQVSDQLPARMRQMYQQQDSSSAVRRNTINALPATGEAMVSAAPPTVRTQHPGESTGGIDVTHPIVSPAWPQSLVPSAAPKQSAEATNRHLDLFAGPVPSSGHVELASQSMRSQGFDMVTNLNSLPSNLYDTGSHEHGSASLHSSTNLPFTTDSNQRTYWDAGDGHRSQQTEVLGYPSHETSYGAIKSEYPIFSLEEMQNLQVPPILQPELGIEEGEDDYFDVASDEGESNNNNQIACTPQNDLGLMVALSASRDDRSLRSYTTFLNEPNILSTYQPQFTASPLMDSMTARIFCHFITATGPSMSIYERHPQNSSMMFTGAAVPSALQALWTYTLPMKALSNQALLHAMLALASLHIARIQHTSLHTSLKHYHYAIRRIAKAVASPSKRTNISTIAATLILSFYEASSSEHSVWMKHLTGARQLLMEVDYRSMTKRIKEESVRAKAGHLHSSWQNPYSGFSNYSGFPNQDELDESLINQIMGRKIRYDEYGRIIDTDPPVEAPKAPITSKDIEEYKIYGDLFFWYCKQDMYQSLISGNRLLLPYSHWSSCPPRACIGRLGAIYGTMDHLLLLMGRIADYASRDLMRKKKVVEANGGQWRPPPGMFPGPPPGGPPTGSTQHHQKSYPTGNAQPTVIQPPMYGMVPNVGRASMPTAFFSAPRDKLYFASSPTEEIGLEAAILEAAKLEAEQEWQDIRQSLEAFQNSLGDEFQPLTADLAPPLSTPFGDSIEYRTWSIACIWIMWLTGAIVLARTHPSMPPAAMVAAGVAAPQTAHWAKRLGRICAGLQPARSSQPLNPSLGAALLESTIGIFFAGVQYQDPHQRKYIIDILRNVAELTGWTSSSMIGAGLEVSWTKMAEAGRGPPYRQTYDVTLKDESDEDTTPHKGDKHSEKRLVVVKPKTREDFAMGIMSMESDFLTKDFTDLSVKI